MAVNLMITSGTWRKIEALPVAIQKNVRSMINRAEQDIQRLLELHEPPGPTEEEMLLHEYKQLCQRRGVAMNNVRRARQHLDEAHQLRERRSNELKEINLALTDFTRAHPDVAKGHIDPAATFPVTQDPSPDGVDGQITWRPEEGGILR